MENVIKQVSENRNYTAVNFGKLSEVLANANGKIFLKEQTKATATEISVGVLPAKTDLPFFHSHKQNEETYIILSGEGNFQVDEQNFPISEGSVIRVSPSGMRGIKNTSNEQMIYLVVQAKENSLDQHTMDDLGTALEKSMHWV